VSVLDSVLGIGMLTMVKVGGLVLVVLEVELLEDIF
jgi:hypothetical protein